MKITDYGISHLMYKFGIRHIALRNKNKIKSGIKSLCKLSTDYSEALSLYTCSTKYPFVYKSLCKKCFKKLPIKI